MIYIVRDPRSVAISNAYHNSISYDQSISDLFDEKIFSTNEGNLLEFRSSWKVNYLSWKKRSCPRLIIRYEDLISDQYQYFKKILNFINDFKKSISSNRSDINSSPGQINSSSLQFYTSASCWCIFGILFQTDLFKFLCGHFFNVHWRSL